MPAHVNVDLTEEVQRLSRDIAALSLTIARILRPNDPQVDVTRCARCGEDHEKVPFKQMARDIDQGYDPPLTHWAPCPMSGDPILMFITDDNE